MGIDIPMFLMAEDLNSIVFKSENSVGMAKITRCFAVRICFFDHFRRGQKSEYNLPLGTIFWPIFPVGGEPIPGEGGVLLESFEGKKIQN